MHISLVIFFTLGIVNTARSYSDGTFIPCTVMTNADVDVTMCPSTIVNSSYTYNVTIDSGSRFVLGASNTVTVKTTNKIRGIHVVFLDGANKVVGTVATTDTRLATSCSDTHLVHADAVANPDL